MCDKNKFIEDYLLSCLKEFPTRNLKNVILVLPTLPMYEYQSNLDVYGSGWCLKDLIGRS